MKFRLYSDLHLEFAKFKIPPLPDDKDTVLLLAGDISVGKGARDFIERYADSFKLIVYCLGNHEFYGREYNKVVEAWKEVDIDNFHFLHNNFVIVEDVKILGGTLWTNFDNNIVYMATARLNMNDYYRISLRRRYLKPSDTVEFHNETVNFLKEELSKDWKGKILVMTHHLPSSVGLHNHYLGQTLNHAYYSDLESLMTDYNIDVWAHGHSHHSHKTKVKNTTVISNARGYHGYESKEYTGFKEDFTFES